VLLRLSDCDPPLTSRSRPASWPAQ
jgi:hypothetical protein